MFKALLLRNFKRVHRSSMWVRRRFTPTGRFLLGVLIFSGALGLDTRINMVHQVFALCLAAVLLSMLWSSWFPGRFEMRRLLPRYATMGEEVRYQIELQNLSSQGEKNLFLIDQLVLTYPTVDEFFHSQEPGEKQRNWFDRKVGYPRWAWLMGWRAGALEPEAGVDHVLADDHQHIVMELKPLRRGWLHFCRLHVCREDPFGLFRARKLLDQPDRLLVLPRRYPIPPINLPGGHKYQLGGVSLASHVGQSEEFVGLRDYRPGDPLSKIHWKGFAKLGKPIVKEYQDEYFVRHALVLDTFGLGEGDVFEAAVTVAASFAARIETRDSLLDLLFFSDEVHQVTSGRRGAGNDFLLEALACVRPCPDRNFARLSDSVIEKSAGLSGCICILLAWDKPRREMVQRLENAGVPSLVLIIAPSEGEESAAESVAHSHPVHRIHPETIEQDLQGL